MNLARSRRCKGKVLPVKPLVSYWEGKVERMYFLSVAQTARNTEYPKVRRPAAYEPIHRVTNDSLVYWPFDIVCMDIRRRVVV